MQTISNVLALDVGEQRVGVAIGNTLARLPRPLETLSRNAQFWGQLKQLITDESVDKLVVGLPRNLAGKDTAQTTAVRDFVATLHQQTPLPITLQDEALTSRQAEAELRARRTRYNKEDIDALAAVYILEDYFNTGAKHD